MQPRRPPLASPMHARSHTPISPVTVAHGKRLIRPHASAADEAFCSADSIASALQRQLSVQGGAQSGTTEALVAYYKRLGCSSDQIVQATASISREFDVGTGEGGSFQASFQQLQLYGYEVLAAAAAFLVITSVQQRPRGWSRRDLLEARPSSVAGMGLFASTAIQRGTVLGAYGGRPRSAQEMVTKVQQAPESKQYAFQTRDGGYLDPTDAQGRVSTTPGPGPFWPFDADVSLCYANEPPKGSRGTNAQVEDGPDGPLDLIFVASRDIEAGEEILIDYGVNYDRSSYK